MPHLVGHDILEVVTNLVRVRSTLAGENAGVAEGVSAVHQDVRIEDLLRVDIEGHDRDRERTARAVVLGGRVVNAVGIILAAVKAHAKGVPATDAHVGNAGDVSPCTGGELRAGERVRTKLVHRSVVSEGDSGLVPARFSPLPGVGQSGHQEDDARRRC